MEKLWFVAVYEYQRNVFKKSFIFTLLSVPLMMAFGIGVGIFMESLQNKNLPVGYVDQAGVFAQAGPVGQAPGASEPLDFIAYPSTEAADAALETGKIQVYYLLQADYVETRGVERVYIEEPGENAQRQFYDFLQYNLLAGQTAAVAARGAMGSQVTVRSLDGKRTFSPDAPTFGVLMPLFISLAFLAMILMSSGYLMTAVAEEKENRTIEVLATTLSPAQIISGKVLGIVAIGLTLLLVWALVVLIGVFGARQAGVNWFDNLAIDWRVVLASLAIAVPAYVLVAACMAAIGALVSTTQEGQSLSAIFVILHIIPLYVSFVYISNPHSPLAVIMSILPFTALMTVGMRNMFTIVPAWQVWLSVFVQSACALGALWLASRAFRLGLLRYGQRLSLRRLLRSGAERRLTGA